MNGLRLYRMYVGGYWHRNRAGVWKQVSNDHFDYCEMTGDKSVSEAEDHTVVASEIRIVAFASALLVFIGIAVGITIMGGSL